MQTKEIYLAYDKSDGEALVAFIDKQQCESDCEESDTGMMAIKLVLPEGLSAELIDASTELLKACKAALEMYIEVQPVGGWQFVEDSLINAIEKATECQKK